MSTKFKDLENLRVYFRQNKRKSSGQWGNLYSSLTKYITNRIKKVDRLTPLSKYENPAFLRKNE